MYAPPFYRERSLERMLTLVMRWNFGLILSIKDGRIQATHLPFLVRRNADADGEVGEIRLLGHFAAANPQARCLSDGDEVLCIFSGPSAYITPTWYRDEEDVPTYNYSAVHMRGVYNLINDPDEVRSLLQVTVEHHEAPEARPWRMEDIDPAVVEKFMRGVTCFSIKVTSIEGASKHSQDKSETDRESVLGGLKIRNAYQDSELLSDMKQSLKCPLVGSGN